MKKTFLNYIYLLAVVTVLAASCKKTDYLDINAGERPPLSAKQSFINARGENSNLLFWNFTAKLTSTPVAPNTHSAYVDGNFGSVQINVTEGNNTSYIASRVFGNSTSFSATGGPNGPIATFYHSVFAAKTINGNSDSLILLYDDLTDPAAGKVKIRFVHLAKNLAPVDFVHVNGSVTSIFGNTTYGAAGGRILSGDGLSAWSLGPFKEVEAGAADAYRLRNTTDQSEISFEHNDLDTVDLEAGKIYTVFVSNIAGKTSYGLYLIKHEKAAL